MTRITAILTTFNRRQTTLSCLARLEAAAAEAKVALRIVLVDDASSDGTAGAVRERFPLAEVASGEGDLFWNRGMHRGIELAFAQEFDYLLWLNDDTMLRADAISRLLQEAQMLRHRDGRDALLSGATCDATGRVTYGGAASAGGLRRFTYRRVWDANVPVACDVINGNCVLVPAEIARVVGNLDPVFEHAMGDTDYALRTKAAGFGVYVASGFVGQCSNNPVQGSFNDADASFRTRWQRMMSRKGLPPRSYAHFVRRHGGPMWPLYFAWPYVRLISTGWLPRRLR